jgi:hypothetical protein
MNSPLYPSQAVQGINQEPSEPLEEERFGQAIQKPSPQRVCFTYNEWNVIYPFYQKFWSFCICRFGFF